MDATTTPKLAQSIQDVDNELLERCNDNRGAGTRAKGRSLSPSPRMGRTPLRGRKVLRTEPGLQVFVSRYRR